MTDKTAMNITIRRALPGDALEYSACHIASWRSAYRGIVPDEYLNAMSVEKRAEKFRQNLKELQGYAYYCAVYKGKIVGTLIIGKSRDEDKPEAGEVCAIYLTEEFLGKGCGRTMMDFAAAELKRMGWGNGEMIVWALEENARARRFYERYGFAADGARKEIKIGKPLTEVRYIYSL